MIKSSLDVLYAKSVHHATNVWNIILQMALEDATYVILLIVPTVLPTEFAVIAVFLVDLPLLLMEIYALNVQLAIVVLVTQLITVTPVLSSTVLSMELACCVVLPTVQDVSKKVAHWCVLHVVQDIIWLIVFVLLTVLSLTAQNAMFLTFVLYVRLISLLILPATSAFLIVELIIVYHVVEVLARHVSPTIFFWEQVVFNCVALVIVLNAFRLHSISVLIVLLVILHHQMEVLA